VRRDCEGILRLGNATTTTEEGVCNEMDNSDACVRMRVQSTSIGTCTTRPDGR